METAGATSYTHTLTNSWTAGTWYHVVMRWGSSNTSLFINGKYQNSVGTSRSLATTGIDRVGGGSFDSANIPGGAGRYVDGHMDEFATWSRALTVTEIQNVYARGATRLNVSVRSCDDDQCAGESFVGGVNKSYLNLTSLVSLNRYFQYKADFITDNVNFTQSLNNVTIYFLDTTVPTITLNRPVQDYNTTNKTMIFNITA